MPVVTSRRLEGFPMVLSIFTLLLVVAFILAVVGLARQQYFVPCIGVAVLLVVLAFLVGR